MSLFTVPNLLAWILQTGLVIAVAILTLRILRIDAPAVRYPLLRIVLAACLVLPFVQPAPAATDRPGGAVDSSVAFQAAGAEPAPGGAGVLAPMFDGSWSPIFLVLLAGGMCVRLVWMAAGVVMLRRLRSAGQVAPPDGDHQELQRVIGANATIRYVPDLGQPVTFGLRRPVILLPDRLQAQPGPIRRAVVAHELWHVRRRDWGWTVAEETARAVFWFHPAIWILLSKIQFAREEIVDELTILATGSRRHYLDALLAFADHPPLAAATAFARRRHLVHRMVLISKEAVMSAKRVVVYGAMFVLATGATGLYAARAFPLVQSGLSADLHSVVQAPGPLERRARPVTPENPVPRRTYSVEPERPGELEAIDAHGFVRFRVTLDDAGRVAEVRLQDFRLTTGSTTAVRLNNVTAQTLEAAMNGSARFAPDQPPQPLRPLVEASIEAALRSVRQWQFAPPAAPPLAFTVTVPVGVPPPPPPPPPPLHARRPGMPPPPPPPPPAAGGSVARQAGDDDALRVGGNIKAPTKIKNVNPVYPEDAKEARIQGVVIIEARIERDGTVGDARILRSIPMLDEAALDAVRQWEFTPTLMNGAPVPVIMTVTINFTLQ
jgi:TonB family protein